MWWIESARWLSWLKHLPLKPDALTPIPKPHRQQERTDSTELSSVLYMAATACMHTQRHTWYYYC